MRCNMLRKNSNRTVHASNSAHIHTNFHIVIHNLLFAPSIVGDGSNVEDCVITKFYMGLLFAALIGFMASSTLGSNGDHVANAGAVCVQKCNQRRARCTNSPNSCDSELYSCLKNCRDARRSSAKELPNYLLQAQKNQGKQDKALPLSAWCKPSINGKNDTPSRFMMSSPPPDSVAAT